MLYKFKNLFGGTIQDNLLAAIDAENFEEIIKILNTNYIDLLSEGYIYERSRQIISFLIYKFTDSYGNNDKYREIFELIKNKYNFTYDMIKPFTRGEIMEYPEKMQIINNIFKVRESIKICNHTMVPIKNIEIQQIMINTIAILDESKKGIFAGKNKEQINDYLRINGYTIDLKSDDRNLSRIDRMLKTDKLFDYDEPVDLEIHNYDDKFTISNGRHRVTKALIEGRTEICAKKSKIQKQ